MPTDPVCGMDVDETPFYADVNGKRYFFCSAGCLHLFSDDQSKYLNKYRYELIIVGGGPAGLTAGVYASIFRLDTLLLTADLGGQAVDSAKIKNYMGFDFITGPELKKKFEDQLIHKNFVAHRIATVSRIKRENGHFAVQLKDGTVFRALCVIVATGMSRNRLNVPGEEEFQRRGVCYSVVQDGTLFAKKDVMVVGGGNSATQAATELSRICRSVTVVSLTPLTADDEEIEKISRLQNVTVYEEHQVERIGGSSHVEWVDIRSRSGGPAKRIPVEGVFVEIGFFPNSGLVADLAELNDRGEIKINPDCSTSCPGLFAAGDVTNAYGKRIIIAAGEGAKAAMAAKGYIRQQKARQKAAAR